MGNYKRAPVRVPALANKVLRHFLPTYLPCREKSSLFEMEYCDGTDGKEIVGM
jgi:hypothetical protein